MILFVNWDGNKLLKFVLSPTNHLQFRFGAFLLFSGDPPYLIETQNSLIGFLLTTESSLNGWIKSSGGHQTEDTSNVFYIN